MIVYTFRGFYGSFTVNRDTVNISYEPSNRTISARQTNTAPPKVSYTRYETYPGEEDLVAGTLISEFTEGDELVKIFFRTQFPFAYVEVEEIEPETETLVINSVAVTPQSEQGINDGVAIISVSGGTPPYLYSINGALYQTSNTFTGLPPGLYSVFVRTESDPITQGTFTIEPATDTPPVIEPIVKDLIVEANAEIEIQNAYKRVEVESKFGSVPSLLLNGDFEQWDGQNFLFWTRFGGLNFSRVQREVKNANGVNVPIENWAIRFNEKADPNRFYQSSPVPVKEKDTIKVSFRVSQTIDISESTFREILVNYPRVEKVHNLKRFYAARIRVKVGNYYLYNESYSSNFIWTTGIATVSIDVTNRNGDLNTFLTGFQIPEVPVSGNVIFQLFGFEKILMESTYLEGNTVQNRNETTEFKVLNEYTPVTMDDFDLSKSNDPKDNDVVGVLSVSENARFYTEKPDKIDILFGDYFNSASGASALSNLYAINVGNKQSIGWYEYGSTSGAIAFGLSLAKTILKAYQKPFIMWRGNLHLKPMVKEFSYLETMTFDVPDQPKFNSKVFTMLGGDFDLKTNQATNVTLAETFERPGKSTDITVPSYPGTTPPVFVQDPNGNTDDNGIFTDEFTQEFS